MAAKRKIRPVAGADGRSAMGGVAGSAGSYDDWTVAELRQRAKELGLTGYAGKKKSALVALLRNH
jgi:hypothetical protein